jgi:hypothetical protein
MLLAFLVASAWAGPPPADDGALSEFLKLREKLPTAVCDESQVARAPTLESTQPAPLGGFRLRTDADESRLIGFLLGDPFLSVTSPYLESLWGPERAKHTERPAAAARLAELKRRLSLDVCTSLVTPGKLKGLLAATPSRFLPAEVARPVETRPLAGASELVVRDIDSRFGRIGKTWWIPGWIDPHEVLSARVGRREYRRLANPVTNRLQFITVMGRDELPLGTLTPSAEPPVMSWEDLKKAAGHEGTRARLAELYRLMVELEAYRAVAREPGRAEEIRKLHEFYRNLIGAYQVYPDDPQFARYSGAARKLMGEREIRELLDRGFFGALDAAWVNGARVAFHWLPPDARLHGMFSEYRKRLLRR